MWMLTSNSLDVIFHSIRWPIFSVFGAAHPQGWRVSLIQALGWKKHASQTERAAKEEEQEVWTSHQIERKAPGMRSYLSAGLPCKCACLSHLHTSACIPILTDCSFLLYVTWRWRFLRLMMITHSALKCRRISYVSTATVLSAVVTISNATFSPTRVFLKPFHHLTFHIKRCIE